MQVQVRQFIRPNGRQEMRFEEIPDRYEDLYKEMQASGCELQAEALTTGELSLTISNKEQDVDITITRDDAQVQMGICQLLENANWR